MPSISENSTGGKAWACNRSTPWTAEDLAGRKVVAEKGQESEQVARSDGAVLVHIGVVGQDDRLGGCEKTEAEEQRKQIGPVHAPISAIH